MRVICHGNTSATIVVLHGGPGAPGSASGLASGLYDRLRTNSVSRNEPVAPPSVLEPYQTQHTITDQCNELDAQLARYASAPVVLIGWSWGAMLALLYAARRPEHVTHLILVGCGPLETRYASTIMSSRLALLPAAERAKAQHLISSLLKQPDHTVTPDVMNERMARFAMLMQKADSVDPIDTRTAPQCDYAQHMSIWTEAAAMRSNGELLKAASRLRCPVTILHGDSDPHPLDGVRHPLERVHCEVSTITLPQCGHTPWNERQARERFFDALVDCVTCS